MSSTHEVKWLQTCLVVSSCLAFAVLLSVCAVLITALSSAPSNSQIVFTFVVTAFVAVALIVMQMLGSTVWDVVAKIAPAPVRRHRLAYTAMMLSVLVVMLTTGCASTPAYREISMADSPALAATAEPTESGKIAFTRELGFFEKLFAKKEPQPSLAATDIAITGRRTDSKPPKKTETNNTFIKVLDAVIREEAWSYEWHGSAKTDGLQIPLVLHMRVTDGFTGKDYNLTSAYSRMHEKPQGFKAHLKNLVGVDTSSKLALEKRITGEKTEIPFEVARLTARDGTVYHVQAVRMFASAEGAPKPTRRSLIFARDQRYRITADAEAGATVYADCSLDDFTLYPAATVDETRRTSIKECVGLFCAFLWSLDEHERTSAMLN